MIDKIPENVQARAIQILGQSQGRDEFGPNSVFYEFMKMDAADENGLDGIVTLDGESQFDILGLAQNHHNLDNEMFQLYLNSLYERASSEGKRDLIAKILEILLPLDGKRVGRNRPSINSDLSMQPYRLSGNPFESPGIIFAPGVLNSGQFNPAMGFLNFGFAGSSELGSQIAFATNNYIGTSTAAGPGGGDLACAWSVNNIFKSCGIYLDGNTNSVKGLENSMRKSGRFVQISKEEAGPGDVALTTGAKNHVGTFDANGVLRSNSSSNAAFVNTHRGRTFGPYYGNQEVRYYRAIA